MSSINLDNIFVNWSTAQENVLLQTRTTFQQDEQSIEKTYGHLSFVFQRIIMPALFRLCKYPEEKKNGICVFYIKIFGY